MQWVEKASIEKIHRLLEVFEQEHHCEVPLTLKNLADVKRSPAPYSLPIIPRSLPLEIVDGEHFVTTNLLSLLVGRAPSSRGQRPKHRAGNKCYGSHLFPQHPLGGILAPPYQYLVKRQKVFVRRSFPCQEKGLVLPLKYRR